MKKIKQLFNFSMTLKFSAYIIIFVLFFIFTNESLSQKYLFERDSLGKRVNINRSSLNKQIPFEVLKGIVAANYGKKNLIEYIPLTSVEITRISLPEIKVHPRLITLQQLTQVEQKLHSQPNSQWYQLLKDHSQKYLLQPKQPLIEPVNRQAEDIKNLAFLYRIEGDVRYLEATTHLIKQLPEPPQIFNLEGGKSNKGWGDYLQTAEAIPALCVALDLLYGEIDQSVLEDSRRKITQIGQQLLDAMLLTPSNNHMVVMATAILVITLFEDNPQNYISSTRYELWNAGLEYLSRGLGLIVPDGGYAEGVYYGKYILKYLAPLSVYLKNSTGILLFQHPYLERMINWVIANDKGSGQYSAFDDAYQIQTLILPLIIAESRLKNEWLAYWNSKPPLQKVLPNFVEAITVFRSYPAAYIYSPAPVQFFPEMGQVIFRDRTLNPNFFASFISEREIWFSGRHEHIDPLSFELSAYGEDFIIDGGYGTGTGDVNRRWYISAQAHNGILVDGLGTYMNPIWGDPLSSIMQHSFQTVDAAATSMVYQIEDVKLQRKIYFFQNRYLLLIDKFEGDKEHSIAQNYNYRGKLVRLNQNHIQISQNNSILNVITANSPDENFIVTNNFGMYTPPGSPQHLSTIQIEQSQVKEGYIFTLLYPQKSTATPLRIFEGAMKGRGELRKIHHVSETGSEFEIAINNGNLIKSARWGSDAKILWIKYDQSMRITGILLVDFTTFKNPGLSFESNFPITLFLQYMESSWQGYIECDEENFEYQLTVEGIQQFPMRFNRQPLIPFREDGGLMSYQLKGSGTLDLGNGHSIVQIPYRYHSTLNLLQWLALQHSRAPIEYDDLSNYDRQIFNNRLVRSLKVGIDETMGYWGNRLFDNPRLITQTANAISGILQESYTRSSSSTYSLRIPHRYRFESQSGNIDWSILEEGTFSLDGVNVRNLRLNASMMGGKGVIYRVAKWFRDHRMHQIRLYAENGSFIFYQNARFKSEVQQQFQFRYQKENISFNPGYSWSNRENSNITFLNWRMKQYHGSIYRTGEDDNDQYYENFSSFGNMWSVVLQGQQHVQENRQNYQVNWTYRFNQMVTLWQGFQSTKHDQWSLPYAYSEFNLTTSNLGMMGRIQRLDSEYYQNFYMMWSEKQHAVSAGIDLNNFKFRRQNNFQLRWNYHHASGWRFYSNVLYHFAPEYQKYTTALFHSLWIPLDLNFSWQPIFGEIYPFVDPIQWIGSAISYDGNISYYGQVLANRIVRPVLLNYQINLNFGGCRRMPHLDIWFQAGQRGDALYMTEIRVQHSGISTYPGIYYSYIRDMGIRFEGFMQWKW